MLHLQVERRLNTRDRFRLNHKIYQPIGECEDSIQCIEIDKHNYSCIVKVAKEDIPLSFPIYDYRIMNFKEFERDRVIFAYVVKENRVLKVHGIIRRCSHEAISFAFGDIGGEIKTQSLTARQIAKDEIVILMYEEPVIP